MLTILKIFFCTTCEMLQMKPFNIISYQNNIDIALIWGGLLEDLQLYGLPGRLHVRNGIDAPQSFGRSSVILLVR